MRNRASLEFARVMKGGLLPLLAIILLSLSPSTSSAQRRERVVDKWRPLHYDVTIGFNDQLSEITSARTAVDVLVLKDNVNKIDLDFGALPIDSITLDGQAARYERQPELLNVELPHTFKNGEKLTITVTYHGRPKDGLVLATDRDGKPSATGDNWPNRVHQWIPCLDHPSAKATVSFTVAAPARDLVIANGKLVTMTRNGAAPSLWRFEETRAIPSYCMVIAVNEGAKIDADQKSVTPLSYYVPQRDRSHAAKGFSPAAPAVSLFSEMIAPYPYEKLALIIGATRYGGMENSSAIVFTSTLFDERPNEKMSLRFGIPARIEDVVAHEIAHQWFGDSVTESTWADLWLSEGFATYFAGLFIEKYEGEEQFRAYLHNAAERYFAYEKERRAPIHDSDTEDLNKLLNPNNYQKGAWVLHMLRKRLGDDAFFKGLRIYYHAHHQANATTEDLREALEKASARSLKDFFARWVYDSGHPTYEVQSEWSKLATGEIALLVHVNQTQPDDVFSDPITIEVTSGGTKTRRTIQPTKRQTTIRFSLTAPPTSVNLDPDEALLKEVVK